MTELADIVRDRRSIRLFLRDKPVPRQLLDGLSIGYPDPAFVANSLETPRNPVEANVVFVDS